MGEAKMLIFHWFLYELSQQSTLTVDLSVPLMPVLVVEPLLVPAYLFLFRALLIIRPRAIQ